MALTVEEAIAVNTLGDYLLTTGTKQDGQPRRTAPAREALELLVNHASRTLQVGWNARDVRSAWCRLQAVLQRDREPYRHD